MIKMVVPIQMNHFVSLTKPLLVNDAATNVGKLDYSLGVATVYSPIQCKVDFQSSNTVVDEEGNVIQHLGVFFTLWLLIEDNDVFTFEGNKYRIDTTKKQLDAWGAFSHYECQFDKAVKA